MGTAMEEGAERSVNLRRSRSSSLLSSDVRAEVEARASPESARRGRSFLREQTSGGAHHDQRSSACKRPTLTRQSTIIGINISQFSDFTAQSRPSQQQLSCKDTESPLPRSSRSQPSIPAPTRSPAPPRLPPRPLQRAATQRWSLNALTSPKGKIESPRKLQRSRSAQTRPRLSRSGSLNRLVVASHNATSPSSLLLAPKSEEPSLISELRQFYLGSKEERVQRAASLTEEEKAEYELINSDQMLLQRESIRFSARIRSLLTMVWLAADSDFSGKLDKPEYMLLNQKLQVAVIGRFDPVEGAAMAEEDWEIDSSGLDHLNFASFSHSWFQIVDLWTDEVNEDVYFAFLNQLVQRMLVVGENGTLRFRENDDIVSQEEYEELKAHGRWQGIEVAANPLEARRRHCPPDREKLAVARRKKLLQEKKKAAMARALVIARFSLSDKAKAQCDSLCETRTSKAFDKPFQDDIENFDTATAQGHRKLSAPAQSVDEAISKTNVDYYEEHEQVPETSASRKSSRSSRKSYRNSMNGIAGRGNDQRFQQDQGREVGKLGQVRFGKVRTADPGDHWGATHEKRRLSRRRSELSNVGRDTVQAHMQDIARRQRTQRPGSARSGNGSRRTSVDTRSRPASAGISRTDTEKANGAAMIPSRQPPMCGLVTPHDLQIDAGPLGELPERHSQKRNVETFEENPVPIVYMRKVTRNRPYKHEGLSVFAPRKQAQVLEMAHRLGGVKDEGPSGGHAAVAHAATKCKFTAIRDWLEAPCGKPWQAMQDSEIHFGTASAGLL